MKGSFVGQDTVNGPKKTKRAEGGRNRNSSKKLFFDPFPWKQERARERKSQTLLAAFWALCSFPLLDISSQLFYPVVFWKMIFEMSKLQASFVKAWAVPLNFEGDPSMRDMNFCCCLNWSGFDQCWRRKGEGGKHACKNPNKSIPWSAGGPHGAGRQLCSRVRMFSMALQCCSTT